MVSQQGFTNNFFFHFAYEKVNLFRCEKRYCIRKRFTCEFSKRNSMSLSFSLFVHSSNMSHVKIFYDSQALSEQKR